MKAFHQRELNLAIRAKKRGFVRIVMATFLATLLGMSTLGLGDPQAAPANAATLAAPVVYKVQAYNNRMDSFVDELRADFVLKVPTGFVDPVTGALTQVDGLKLSVGYDYDEAGTRLAMGYINTMDGAAGALRWAKNQDQYYTIHKVIRSGESDFLVISMEGDMDRVSAGTNVLNGRLLTQNWYFSYSANPTTNGWISTARTVQPVDYRIQSEFAAAANVNGPMLPMPFDNTALFWSARQANWGQVLDFGLDSQPPGVLPPNSVGVELKNRAFNTLASGPANSVTDSFWYAWVHEDGSLVTTINTAPIHVENTPTGSNIITGGAAMVKNMKYADDTRATLANVPSAAAQGLTSRVGVDGSVDFRDAGGNGYYRLAVFPETRNPTSVKSDYGAPSYRYQASDLVQNGKLTALANERLWVLGSAYYKYNIAKPQAPVITQPAQGSYLSDPKTIVVKGTGTPGASITLKFVSGNSITDVNSASLTTMVNGDRVCAPTACQVIVQPDGTWSYTYVAPTALADGQYTVVAFQTEQTSGFALTSDPSNPDVPANPTKWGVTFLLDTKAPAAPAIVCPVSPSEEKRPTFSGTGLEAGAKVRIYLDGVFLEDATVAGSSWSYRVSAPLADGRYAFQARQVDRAGNESPSSVTCTYQVVSTVAITGAKRVQAVDRGVPALGSADPSNWEIVVKASDASGTNVISGGTPFQLKRGVSYTLGERLAAGAQERANYYTQAAPVQCADSKGVALPSSIFDQASQTITIGNSTVVEAPIRCELVNRTAQVSMLAKRVGGTTGAAPAGWSLVGQNNGSNEKFVLTSANQHAEAKAADYAVSAQLPSGMSLVAIQQLNIGDANCAPLVNNAETAPESCWIQLGKTASVPVGVHSVYRMVAAAPGDMPAIPVTGGMGSWLFTLGGATAFFLAGAFYLLRLRRNQIQA